MSLRRSTTDEEDDSTVAGEERNSRKELNVAECTGVMPFRAIHGVLYVVGGNYEIPPLINALL